MNFKKLAHNTQIITTPQTDFFSRPLPPASSHDPNMCEYVTVQRWSCILRLFKLIIYLVVIYLLFYCIVWFI